jgi:nucleoside-diphosphate-sugar epimerase
MVTRAAGIKTRVIKMPLTLARIYGYLWDKNARRTGTQPTVTHREVAYSHKWLFYDVSKAQRELGLEPTPVEVSLERAIEWFKREGYIPRSDPWVSFTSALARLFGVGLP